MSKERASAIFVRIEPSSSVPIYRQVVDQIRYQIATGVLGEGHKLPSVRELAIQIAVNQNTILKVYNELCRENVLRTERGDGTYVATGKQTLKLDRRKAIVADVLRQAVIQAVQLELSLDQIKDLLGREYESIAAQKAK